MTSDRRDNTSYSEVIEILSREGFEGMAEVFKILMNEAMKAERAAVFRLPPMSELSIDKARPMALSQRQWLLEWARFR